MCGDAKGAWKEKKYDSVSVKRRGVGREREREMVGDKVLNLPIFFSHYYHLRLPFFMQLAGHATPLLPIKSNLYLFNCFINLILFNWYIENLLEHLPLDAYIHITYT